VNFTEFSFWWFLLLAGSPLFTLRFIFKRLEYWHQKADSYLLAFLSLALFWNAARYSFIIFVSELIANYLAVNVLIKTSPKKARWIALGIIVLDLSVLVYYKYVVFLLQGVLSPLANVIPFLDIILPASLDQGGFQITGIPPGISFYTFQMVGFVVDSLKSNHSKNVSLINYINFASFFPQVVAGPIERRSDLLPQIQEFKFKFTIKQFEDGFQWLILGLFMKLVLADNIAAYILLDESRNPWLIWLGIVLFGFRIYFDFAGYSLIALGIAKVIGVKLTLNFEGPYISQNIQEFWRRWHVTLSSWFRDYIYIPLGGSRVPWAPFNLFIVFAISGLWHGAGWNFIVWGAYHGLLLVGHRYLKNYIRLPAFLNWLLTNFSVFVGWLFFMDPDFGRIITKVKSMLTPSAYNINSARQAWQTFSDIEQGTMMLSLALVSAILISEHLSARRKDVDVYYLLRSSWVTPLLIGATLLFSASTATDFIYFEF
jgi:D-alanyl-lipoteichoic acid acyltransferase DltB (MBOAT superfamily)